MTESRLFKQRRVSDYFVTIYDVPGKIYRVIGFTKIDSLLNIVAEIATYLKATSTNNNIANVNP